MMIKPMAIGIFVVPDCIEFSINDIFGIKYPTPTPIIIARNIHNVR
jgi:hypothetical protein